MISVAGSTSFPLLENFSTAEQLFFTIQQKNKQPSHPSEKGL